MLWLKGLSIFTVVGGSFGGLAAYSILTPHKDKELLEQISISEEQQLDTQKQKEKPESESPQQLPITKSNEIETLPESEPTEQQDLTNTELESTKSVPTTPLSNNELSEPVVEVLQQSNELAVETVLVKKDSESLPLQPNQNPNTETEKETPQQELIPSENITSTPTEPPTSKPASQSLTQPEESQDEVSTEEVVVPLVVNTKEDSDNVSQENIAQQDSNTDNQEHTNASDSQTTIPVAPQSSPAIPPQESPAQQTQ